VDRPAAIQPPAGRSTDRMRRTCCSAAVRLAAPLNSAIRSPPGGLQAAHPGLRPVLFHSPYEAAAWAMLSQRRHRSQATALRRRISAQIGQQFELGGQTEHAFPVPDRLLGLTGFPGLEPRRLERLHGVARAALQGKLEPGRLAAMGTEEAMAELRAMPGLGPVYAGLVLLRSTGVTDALTAAEPRLPRYL